MLFRYFCPPLGSSESLEPHTNKISSCGSIACNSKQAYHAFSEIYSDSYTWYLFCKFFLIHDVQTSKCKRLQL